MNKMVVYTCPKCGGDLQELCLTSLPPQYKVVCNSCGWSETKKSEPLEVVRVPYQSETACVNDEPIAVITTALNSTITVQKITPIEV